MGRYLYEGMHNTNVNVCMIVFMDGQAEVWMNGWIHGCQTRMTSQGDSRNSKHGSSNLEAKTSVCAQFELFQM